MRLLRHRTQASALKHDSTRLFELRSNSVSLFLFSQNSMQLLLFAGDWIRLAPDSTRLCSLRSDSTKGYSPKPRKLIFWILYAAQKLYISKHFPYSKVTILGSPCGGWGTLVEQVSYCLTLKGEVSCSSGSSGKPSYCFDSRS